MVSLWVVVETLTCWGIEGPRDSPPFHLVKQGSAHRGGGFPWVVLSEKFHASRHIELVTPGDRCDTRKQRSGFDREGPNGESQGVVVAVQAEIQSRNEQHPPRTRQRDLMGWLIEQPLATLTT